MRLLRVAVLELKDKALLLALGLLVGLTAFVIPMLLNLRGQGLAEARAAHSAIYGFGTVLVVSLLLGAGQAGPDMQEGRLGFFFGRPLRSADLWGGRLLASLGMTQLCGLLAFLPSLLIHGEFVLLGKVQGPLAILGLAGILIGNAVSVSLRARTAWLLLDLLTLAAALLGFAGMLWRLWAASAFEVVGSYATGFGILLLVTLGAGGLSALAFGRTDLKRGHRALSLSLAAGTALTLLVAFAFTQSVLRIGRDEPMLVNGVVAADQGPWAILQVRRPPAKGRPEGSLEWTTRGVLFNTETGVGLRIQPEDATLSKNGRRAAWFSPVGGFFGTGHQLWVADLSARRVKIWKIQVPTRDLELPYFDPKLTLSQDGRHLALFWRTEIVVYSLESGAVLAKHAIPPGAPVLNGELVPLRGDRVRAYIYRLEAKERVAEIYEFDFTEGSLARTGELPLRSHHHFLHRDPERDALLLGGEGGAKGGMEILDGRTGQTRAVLSKLSSPGRSTAVFLSDGRIAVLDAAASGARFRLLDSAGAGLWEKELLPSLPLREVDKVSVVLLWNHPDHGLLARIRWSGAQLSEQRPFSVDLDARTVTPVPPSGLRDQIPLSGRMHEPARPGSFASRLRITAKGTLVRLEAKGWPTRLAGPP